jgi:hypothetical protein
MLMPRWVVLIVLSLSSMTLSAGEGIDGCLKRVFSHYCLGGSISLQLQQHPADMDPIVNGDRAGVIYAKGRERVYVMAYRGRIYKVLKTYDPSSRVTLQRLQRGLSKKYGKHRDISHLPNHARNLAGEIGAVRRGEGELKYRWQRPGSLWRVELGWSRKFGISLAYLVNALDQRQREADESSL